MREQYPLSWPDGWPRTLIGDRKTKTAWKKTEKQALEALDLELKRFDALSWYLTRKDPADFRTAPDPSVAIHFSRRREEDYSWQGALGISNPAPTIEEIETAFRKLGAKYHPDNQQTGDHETYIALARHKKNAMDYVNRLSGKSPDFVIACDSFKDARWNIIAIAHTIHSLRQMERDGTSRLLERAMTSFASLPEASHVHASAS